LSSIVIHVKSSYKFVPTVHNILTNVDHHIVLLFIKSFWITCFPECICDQVLAFRC
jgi:hypothetical protein